MYAFAFASSSSGTASSRMRRSSLRNSSRELSVLAVTTEALATKGPAIRPAANWENAP